MKDLKQKITDLMAIIFGIVIVFALYWWLSFQWNLCIDAGFNFWYCIQHIG